MNDAQDEELKKLAEATIRYLVYVIRWLARRYGLEHLVKIK